MLRLNNNTTTKIEMKATHIKVTRNSLVSRQSVEKGKILKINEDIHLDAAEKLVQVRKAVWHTPEPEEVEETTVEDEEIVDDSKLDEDVDPEEEVETESASSEADPIEALGPFSGNAPAKKAAKKAAKKVAKKVAKN